MSEFSFCRIHVTVPVQSFCDNCLDGICWKCYNSHKGHKIHALHYIFPKYQSVIINDVLPMLEREERNLDKCQYSWEESLHCIEKKSENLKKTLSDQLNIIIQAINKKEKVLLEDVRKTRQKERFSCEKAISDLDRLHRNLADVKLDAYNIAYSGKVTSVLTYKDLRRKVKSIEEEARNCLCDGKKKNHGDICDLQLVNIEQLMKSIDNLAVEKVKENSGDSRSTNKTESSHQENQPEKNRNKGKENKSQINASRKRKLEEILLETLASRRTKNPKLDENEDHDTVQDKVPDISLKKSLKQKNKFDTKKNQKSRDRHLFKETKSSDPLSKKYLPNSQKKAQYLDRDHDKENIHHYFAGSKLPPVSNKDFVVNYQRPTVSYNDFDMFSDGFGNVDILSKEKSFSFYSVTKGSKKSHDFEMDWRSGSRTLSKISTADKSVERFNKENNNSSKQGNKNNALIPTGNEKETAKMSCTQNTKLNANKNSTEKPEVIVKPSISNNGGKMCVTNFEKSSEQHLQWDHLTTKNRFEFSYPDILSDIKIEVDTPILSNINTQLMSNIDIGNSPFIKNEPVDEEYEKHMQSEKVATEIKTEPKDDYYDKMENQMTKETMTDTGHGVHKTPVMNSPETPIDQTHGQSTNTDKMSSVLEKQTKKQSVYSNSNVSKDVQIPSSQISKDSNAESVGSSQNGISIWNNKDEDDLVDENNNIDVLEGNDKYFNLIVTVDNDYHDNMADMESWETLEGMQSEATQTVTDARSLGVQTDKIAEQTSTPENNNTTQSTQSSAADDTTDCQNTTHQIPSIYSTCKNISEPSRSCTNQPSQNTTVTQRENHISQQPQIYAPRTGLNLAESYNTRQTQLYASQAEMNLAENYTTRQTQLYASQAEMNLAENYTTRQPQLYAPQAVHPWQGYFSQPIHSYVSYPTMPLMNYPNQPYVSFTNQSGFNKEVSLADFNFMSKPIEPNIQPQATVEFGAPLYKSNQKSTIDLLPTNDLSSTDVRSEKRCKLELYKKGNLPNVHFKDIMDEVVEFSLDSAGSRFLQNAIQKASTAEISLLIKKIIESGNVIKMAKNAFGFKIFQKLLTYGPIDQTKNLTGQLFGHVYSLSSNTFGSRVIQSVVAMSSLCIQLKIVKKLNENLLQCILDTYGYQVIRSCLEHIPLVHLQPVIDVCIEQVKTVSTDPFGNHVIQKILERTQKIKTVHDAVLDCLNTLIQNMYGANVIKCLIEQGTHEDHCKVIDWLKDSMLSHCVHKFGSGIVETCLTCLQPPDKAILIKEVCLMNERSFTTMVIDKFGSSVLKKMLEVAKPHQNKVLVLKIQPYVTSLVNNILWKDAIRTIPGLRM